MPAASRGASPADIATGQQSVPGSPTGTKETRETMRKFLIIFAFFFVVLPIRATDLYIAQTATGGSTGADCSDALPYTFFNKSSNWPSPIGPGTTVHICGTITAPAGAGAFLTFQGSGVSGNPITLKFENGAVLAAPYFAGTGAINTGGHNYITIDGNNLQGTIENTLSGTSGAACLGGPCAFQPDYSYGIYCLMGGSNLTIQNLNIIDMYIHASASDENGQDSYGINCGNGNNIVISGNVIHDMKWAISAGVGGGTWAGFQVSGNTISNADHGVYFNVGGGSEQGPVNIFGNDIQCGSNWDDAAGGNHHDNIHISAVAGINTLLGVSIYNNYLHGDPGANTTSYFFTFPDAGDEGPINIFNNVFVDTSATNFTTNGFVRCVTAVCNFYNNTTFAVANNNGQGQPNAGETDVAGSTRYNNIIVGATGIGFINGGPNTADYNNFYQCCGNSPKMSSIGVGDIGGIVFYTSLPAWQTAGFDAHGTVGNPLLNSSSNPPYQLTSSKSAAWQTGKNLTSMCSGQPNPGLGALCFDKLGVARPATGPWDMGAYASSASASAPPAPTGLSALVQ